MNRMNFHSNQYGLFPARQSAYRQHHSTQTAATIVHNDNVRSTNVGFVSSLMLLDLSAAVDTVDHGILLEVLAERIGVQNLELDWFRSYTLDARRLSQLQAAARLQLCLSTAFLKYR